MSAGLALMACSADGGGGSASCAAPQLRVDDGRVAAGQQVTVTGRSFFDDCFDQGEEGDPPASRGVKLTLRQGGEAYDLGAADAQADGTARWRVELPTELRAGRARLGTPTSEPLELRIEPEDEIVSSTSAVCAAPQIRLRDREVRAGERFTVTGRAFIRGCDDTGQSEPEIAMRDIGLDLVQGDRAWPLGFADADARGRVTWTVQMPDDVRPGTARLTSSGAPTARGRRYLPVTVLADR